MKGILVIRKYKNRRLYDTERSCHVTQEELLDLVRSGRDIRVQEVDTSEDVTVETLLLLIQSERGLAASILTADFLHFLVRADAGLSTRFLKEYFPLAIQQFQAMVAGMERQRQMALSMGPFGAFASPWGFGMPGAAPPSPAPSAPPPPSEPAAEPAATSGDDDAEALKEELRALRRELDARKSAQGKAAKRSPRRK